MGDRKPFYEDAALDRVDTRIVESGIEDGRFWVRDMLRIIATSVLEKRPEAVVVLVGDGREAGGEVSFLVQAGARGPEDVSSIGESLAHAVDGRGGGKSRLFQGRGGRSPTQDVLRSLLE